MTCICAVVFHGIPGSDTMAFVKHRLTVRTGISVHWQVFVRPLDNFELGNAINIANAGLLGPDHVIHVIIMVRPALRLM